MSITFNMKKFGRTLTDRPDGKKAFLDITSNGSFPDTLDFAGVMSLGSSFGDEVIPKLAAHHGNRIRIMNANSAIVDCISKIEEDTGIKAEILEN